MMGKNPIMKYFYNEAHLYHKEQGHEVFRNTKRRCELKGDSFIIYR